MAAARTRARAVVPPGNRYAAWVAGWGVFQPARGLAAVTMHTRECAAPVS